MRLLSIVGALLIATSAWAQHGQTGPQPIGEGAGGPGHGTNALQDAVAIYTFDDHSNLGLEGVGGNGNPSYNLTPTNDPTATGGALGYAMNLASASTQHATIADNADLSLGSGESFTVCAWARSTVSSWGNQGIAGKWDAATASQAEYTLYTASNTLNLGISDGTTRTAPAVSAGSTAGADNERHFACGGLDNAGNIVFAQWDGTYNSSAYSNDGNDSSTNFYVGNLGDGSNYDFDGDIGPVYWWSEAKDETFMDALYNSGKGKTCGELTAAEQTNLVSCWDMDEDGGPYLDEVKAGLPDVSWTSKVNVTEYSGPTRLTKTGGSNGVWDAGAASVMQLSYGDGYVEVDTNQTGYYRTFGLSNGDTDQTEADIDFGLRYWAGGLMYVVENGAYPTGNPNAPFTLGSVPRVAVVNGAVQYSVDGTVFYTSTATPTYPLLVDTAFHTSNGRLDNVKTYGFGHVLTAINTPTQSAALVDQPKSGMGTKMDNANDAYYILDSGLDSHTGAFTLAAWVRYPSAATITTQGLIGLGGTGWTNGTSGSLYLAGNGILCLVGGTTYSASIATGKGSGAYGENWVHVACKYTDSGGAGGRGQTYVYVDGVEYGPDNLQEGSGTRPTPNKFVIGRYYPTISSASWEDEVDSVSYWDRALTADEIKRLHEDRIYYTPVRE